MKHSKLILIVIGILLMLPAAGWGEMKGSALEGELMQAAGGDMSISYHPVTGKARFFRTADGKGIPHAGMRPSSMTHEKAAVNFMKKYGDLFGLSDAASELKVMKKRTVEGNRTFVRHQQTHQGIPVFGGELIVQMDADMQVMSANGKVAPQSGINTVPSISAQAAEAKARELVAKQYNVKQSALTVTVPELWIYNPVLLGEKIDKNMLVWRVEVHSDVQQINELVLVDAHRGFIALHFNQMPQFTKNRIIHDNQNLLSQVNIFPGLGPVRREGDGPTGITDVDAAYNNIGLTYDFYRIYHGRDSIDNQGLPLVNTVRHCYQDSKQTSGCPSSTWRNASWNGTQMLYGDGFAKALDIVAHEYTHGVTQYESGLYYYGQSGAIDESLSDVWGELIQQIAGSAAQRWLMGEDLSNMVCNGKPCGPGRSMSDPPLYQDPDKMSSTLYVCNNQDKNGVHHNSGINNKAAYLLVDGGIFNNVSVTGIGITKTIKIYYEAQTNLLTSSSDYEDLYYILQQSCFNLIGSSGITASDCQQVRNTVDAVEMNILPAACPNLCQNGFTPAVVFFDDFNATASNWLTNTVSGSNPWLILTGNGESVLWGSDIPTSSLSYMRTKVPIPIYPNSYMNILHAFDFEYDAYGNYDGGIFAYSTDNGLSWTDAASLFILNGYNGSINSADNPLNGYSAFVGSPGVLGSSMLNLNALAGKNVTFSFWLGTDNGNINTPLGWFIDAISLYKCIDKSPPSSPITLTSSPSSWTNTNSFNIYWINPDDASGIVGSYYKVGSSPINNTDGIFTTSKPFTVTATAEGGQLLYAWLVDNVGNMNYLNMASTMLYYDGTPPSDGALTALGGSSQIFLNWSGITDSGGSGLLTANKYKVMRKLGSYPAAQCTDGDRIYFGDLTSYQDSGLLNGTPYYYRVCAADNALNISSGATAMATLIDPTVQFSTSSSNNSEATTPAVFTVNLSSASSQTVTVNYATSNGTATSGSDYTATSGTLTFSPGETSKTIDVAITNDTLIETDEIFTVTLSSPVNATLGTAAVHTYTINNDDSYGSFQLGAASYSVSESAGTLTITVRRTGGSSGAVSLSYTLSNGTAVMPSDFGFVNTVQGLSMTKTSFGGSSVAGNSNQFSTSNTASGESSGVIGNENRLGGDDNNVAVISGGVINWADGDAADKTITIAIVNDTLNEGNETFTISLSLYPNQIIFAGQDPNAQPVIGSPSSATVTILDDDPMPTVQFSTSSSNNSEAITPAVFTVNLSSPSSQTVTVNYTTSNGTATAGSDYEAASGTLTFAPGETSKTVSVPIVSDTIIETDETFSVELSSPANASLGAISTHTCTIINDDSYGSFQLGSAAYSVSESGGTLTITASRTGGSSGAVSLMYNVSSGTATIPEDFNIAQQNSSVDGVAFSPLAEGNNNTLSGWLSWADGDTSDKTLTLEIINDSIHEGDETFTAALSLDGAQISVVQGQDPAARPVLGSPSTATITIVDDDPTPTVQFSASSSNNSEAVTPAVFTVTLSSASSQTVTVNYATLNGTATAVSDYTATPGVLTFTPGETSKTINVLINNDTAVEGNETFTVTLSNPVNATLGAISTHTYTINNDDNSGIISFSASAYTVSEGTATVTITAKRTGSSTGAVSVTYATSNGTATAGSDYTVKTGTLSWAAGNTANKTFTVSIKNDTLDEENETFFVTLSNPTGGAALGSPSTATVTITDNDNAPKVQFSLASSSGSEAVTNAAITVTLSPASGRTVKVNYATANGTATAGTDYTATSGTLTFNPGVTSQTINVPIINDTAKEVNEKFTVKLSSPVNATLGTRTTHTRTITNND